MIEIPETLNHAIVNSFPDPNLFNEGDARVHEVFLRDGPDRKMIIIWEARSYGFLRGIGKFWALRSEVKWLQT